MPIFTVQLRRAHAVLKLFQCFQRPNGVGQSIAGRCFREFRFRRFRSPYWRAAFRTSTKRVAHGFALGVKNAIF